VIDYWESIVFTSLPSLPTPRFPENEQVQARVVLHCIERQGRLIMDENLKLLVLEGEKPSIDRRLGLRTSRARVLNMLESSGAKVQHDSGGRLIVVEVSEGTEKDLTERLTGVRLMPVDSDVSDIIDDADSTEALFLEALKLRTSKRYRNAKKRRKVGETPEEKALVSGSCVRDEY
jgi:hypothetical protein